MKPTTITTRSADDDEEWDRQDAADVYCPEMQSGEPEIALRLRRAFESHGYLIRDIRHAETHPVVVLRAVRGKAPRIGEPRLFYRHVRGLLCEAGFRLRHDELTVDQMSKRILIAFQWRESPIDYARALRQADEDAAALLERVL